MMRTTTKLAVGAVAVAVAATWLRPSDEAARDEARTEHLTGRLWVDRMPEHDRDIVLKLAVLQSVDHGPFGVLEAGSVWLHHMELFQWTLVDDVLELRWPQSGERNLVRVHTYECEGQAPAPFELCLDFYEHGELTGTMYSQRHWVVQPRDGDELVEEPLVAPLLQWLDRAAEVPPPVPPVDGATLRDTSLHARLGSP